MTSRTAVAAGASDDGRSSRPGPSNRHSVSALTPGATTAKQVPAASGWAPGRTRAGAVGVVTARPAGPRGWPPRGARVRGSAAQPCPAVPVRRRRGRSSIASTTRASPSTAAKSSGWLSSQPCEPCTTCAGRSAATDASAPGTIRRSSSPQKNRTGSPRATSAAAWSASEAVRARRAVSARVTGLRSRFGRKLRSTDGGRAGHLARGPARPGSRRPTGPRRRPPARPGVRGRPPRR